MAGPYYVYHAATTTDGLSWGGAYNSIQALDTAVVLASGEIVYVASDHVDPVTYSGTFAIAGATANPPVVFISANRGTTAYEVASTDQINTSNGAYVVQLDGAFALYGMQIKSGGNVIAYNDQTETFYAENCTFLPGANASFLCDTDNTSTVRLKNCTIDLTQDSTTPRSANAFVANDATVYVDGLTFTNCAYRTGAVFVGNTGFKYGEYSGIDASGFTNGTNCELAVGSSQGRMVFANVKTKSGFTFTTTDTVGPTTDIIGFNVGPEDSPTSLLHHTFNGDLASSTTIYRTGGATAETVATSWLVTTTANCAEGSPYCTPWIYGTISSTGSKTFDLYTTNETADLTDAEVWMEVEYMGTADSPLYALASDHRTITTTAAAQTDDTTSTWTGVTGTYKQKLSVTATVNETGQYRARVAVGKASVTDLYCDPKVTVTAS